jgi:dolichol-phosphate mannosyltransferase
MMAADLQDPPETIGAMLGRWNAGAQVVWATRRHRSGHRAHARFASFYYWIMRRVVGMTDMPARGADFFLLDRAVIDAFKRFNERNVSVLALITWLGFRQTEIEYDKQPRAAGRSGWTVKRKIKLVVDSVTAFSDAPIRFCSYLGVAFIALGIGLGVVLLILRGRPSLGAALLVGMIGLTGVQLVALGIVGEYVWRALDEARGRPAYLIESLAGSQDAVQR